MKTAIILAGGASTRMGFDKKELKLLNNNLMDMQVTALKQIFDEIIIVSNNELCKRAGLAYVEDEIKGMGPLGGIHAGLKKAGSTLSYVIACDMPFIHQGYIEYMKARLLLAEEKPDAVITRYGEWLEPFNAFYSKTMIEKIERLAKTNQKKISTLLESANVLYIREEEARVFSPDWRMFLNINTQDDLKKAEADLKKSELIWGNQKLI